MDHGWKNSPQFDIQEKGNSIGNYKLYIKNYDTNNLDESALFSQ